MKHFDFDVIVIGGGHAGCEAADAAVRLGASVALVTLKISGIGVMSCNPAIGGLGKGHLVREIDAFDGVMARVADRAGIQFRLLNRRKGPAVQGPRAQADRRVYRETMLEMLKRRENLTIIEGEVASLKMAEATVSGVVLADGSEITAPNTILTTGTFLRGVIHIGDERRAGGRMGDKPSVALAEQIDSLGVPFGRLKTGTPPRLDGRSINWDALEMQPGDEKPTMFSFDNKAPSLPQISCGITHTNPRTHEIIQANLARSAMYGGGIEGVGPRYCPSIEDKVVRFSDKSSHQIFLEPEGINDSTVYPNGISTSLPQSVQEEYVNSIVGLESAIILQPGYAIEYDFVNPVSLNAELKLKGFEGLYLAGQINGTTGYEEAAAQGLVAGLNAALASSGRDAIHFSRSDSYIGVMIDDLITRGVAEPYRMFTSRAEFRLSLRADNADQRLTPRAMEIGCVSERRRSGFEDKMSRLQSGREMLSSMSFTPAQLASADISVNQDGARRSGFQLLSYPEISFEALEMLDPQLAQVDAEVREQLSKEAIYSNYLARQERDVEAVRKDERVEIPDDFPFVGLQGLSNELQTKLEARRPSNLAEAARIEGMTPAALVLILAAVRKVDRVRSA